MKDKTLLHLKELDKKIEALFLKLDQLDEKKLAYISDPKVWNVLQVLEHLKNSENMSLNYLKYKKTQQGIKYKKVGMREKFNLWILKKRFESSKGVQAPQNKELNPEAEGLDYNTIKSGYAKVRLDIANYLNEQSEDQFELNLYKHPAIGRISIPHMVKFFDYHLERHKRQITKALENTP